MSFDRAAVRLLRHEVEEALEPLCAKHKFDLHTGTIRFDAIKCSLPLEFTATIGPSGEAVNAEKLEFEAVCSAFGLKPEHYRATVNIAGDPGMRLVAVKPRSTTYPVVCERADGRRVKYTVAAVHAALKIESPTGAFAVRRYRRRRHPEWED